MTGLGKLKYQGKVGSVLFFLSSERDERGSIPWEKERDRWSRERRVYLTGKNYDRKDD